MWEKPRRSFPVWKVDFINTWSLKRKTWSWYREYIKEHREELKSTEYKQLPLIEKFILRFTKWS